MTELRREFSSAGRASALQAGGHRFDPCNSHQNGPVVQLVRTLACHARGRGFEPHPGRHFRGWGQTLEDAQVAQLVEQGTENPRVGSSILSLGIVRGINSVVECHLAKVKVASPNLVSRSRSGHSNVAGCFFARPYPAAKKVVAFFVNILYNVPARRAAPRATPTAP